MSQGKHTTACVRREEAYADALCGRFVVREEAYADASCGRFVVREEAYADASCGVRREQTVDIVVCVERM